MEINGGYILAKIQVKSETSKAKWLMEMVTNNDFRLFLLTFSEMLGIQEGNNYERDLVFMDKSFITRTQDRELLL